MIFNTLNVPADSRNIISIPIQIFALLISLFEALQAIFHTLKIEKMSERFEDAAEIAKIVRYYATEVYLIRSICLLYTSHYLL